MDVGAYDRSRNRIKTEIVSRETPGAGARPRTRENGSRRLPARLAQDREKNRSSACPRLQASGVDARVDLSTRLSPRQACRIARRQDLFPEPVRGSTRTVKSRAAGQVALVPAPSSRTSTRASRWHPPRGARPGPHGGDGQARPRPGAPAPSKHALRRRWPQPRTLLRAALGPRRRPAGRVFRTRVVAARSAPPTILWLQRDRRAANVAGGPPRQATRSPAASPCADAKPVAAPARGQPVSWPPDRAPGARSTRHAAAPRILAGSRRGLARLRFRPGSGPEAGETPRWDHCRGITRCRADLDRGSEDLGLSHEPWSLRRMNCGALQSCGPVERTGGPVERTDGRVRAGTRCPGGDVPSGAEDGSIEATAASMAFLRLPSPRMSGRQPAITPGGPWAAGCPAEVRRPGKKCRFLPGTAARICGGHGSRGSVAEAAVVGGAGRCGGSLAGVVSRARVVRGLEARRFT